MYLPQSLTHKHNNNEQLRLIFACNVLITLTVFFRNDTDSQNIILRYRCVFIFSYIPSNKHHLLQYVTMYSALLGNVQSCRLLSAVQDSTLVHTGKTMLLLFCMCLSFQSWLFIVWSHAKCDRLHLQIPHKASTTRFSALLLTQSITCMFCNWSMLIFLYISLKLCIWNTETPSLFPFGSYCLTRDVFASCRKPSSRAHYLNPIHENTFKHLASLMGSEHQNRSHYSLS